MTPPEWILWAATVGFGSTLSERFAAAVENGYGWVSLSPAEVLEAERDGTPATLIGARARDLDLGLVVDPVMNWYPDSVPSPSRFAGVSTQDALRAGADLGVGLLTAIATATSDVPVADLAAHFGHVCDGAAEFGAHVQLEFMPFTVVPDLRTAWDIVRAANRTNGGIVFDTWHFYRGDPDFGVLARVPGTRILSVQIDDATAVPHGVLRHETAHRLLPGDGGLDLVTAVRALEQIGALRRVGPEIINEELATELAPAAAARRAMDRTKDLLRTALVG